MIVSRNPNRIEISKPNKWRKCKAIIKTFLEDYLVGSTLHGVKYVADPSPWKSLIWLCIMIASISFCAIFIKVQMNKLDESIITTTISSTAFPVWAIPFPAVTICNNIIVSKTGAKKFQIIL
ncbi:Amiloride-sensitive sodium channel [Popillia japonica]|uniref:Amiloride-sensitive sodium channel n=1 Tax=Popillia japonica TaxID=7064 RepID=A0AAW1KL14_POPJA